MLGLSPKNVAHFVYSNSILKLIIVDDNVMSIIDVPYFDYNNIKN